MPFFQASFDVLFPALSDLQPHAVLFFIQVARSPSQYFLEWYLRLNSLIPLR